MEGILREHRRTDKRHQLTAEQRDKIVRSRRAWPRRERRREASRIAAEFCGTLIVTLATVGPSALERGLGLHVGYAVLFGCTGVASAIVIYAFGPISGAHVNPCMTLGFALRGDFDWSRVPGYLAAQALGAVAAGALVLAILHPQHAALQPALTLGPWPAFWLEIVLTAILILVGITTANEARFIGAETAIANGGTTLMLRWVGGWISGGSMNPFRTLGPALLVGGTTAWWVFASAPLIGTSIAVALAWLLAGAPTETEAQKSG